MSFTKQKYTDIEIEIDKVKHKPDTFPLPLDCSKNYFTRYTADTFNVDWNKNYEGLLSPLKSGKNNRIEDNGISYTLLNNDGHYEIESLSARNRKHRISIGFIPAVPDILCLREGIHFEGNFSITTDNTGGVTGGYYKLERKGDCIYMNIRPDRGWKPNENRWILKILFFMVKVFREWPKSYVWNAKITLNNTDRPMMQSAWKRI